MNYYEEIKQELINNEINRRVKTYSINKSDLNIYYNVGKMLSEAGKHYGEGIIKEYSKKLITELNDTKYSYRNLMNMRKYYLIFKDKKVNALRSQLSWTHYRELLPVKNIDGIVYYINMSIKNNLSYRKLKEKIKSKEYERLPESAKAKIINDDNQDLIDFVKNPIMIKNTRNYEIISEKILQKLILEDIENFMKELGNSFCFIGSEYKIKMGDRYNYIDLLLFNIEYNCYVVIELKVTELKKEHIGQIQVYMNYIDTNLRKISQDKTIGIIICKKDDKYIIEYSSDKRIIARYYELV